MIVENYQIVLKILIIESCSNTHSLFKKSCIFLLLVELDNGCMWLEMCCLQWFILHVVVFVLQWCGPEQCRSRQLIAMIGLLHETIDCCMTPEDVLHCELYCIHKSNSKSTNFLAIICHCKLNFRLIQHKKVLGSLVTH